MQNTALAAMFAGKRPVEPGRQQHHAQCRRKAQLQADAARCKGVLQKDHSQRRRQRGKPIAAPPEQRRDQQKDLHDAGAHHRRRQSRHHHVEEQYRDGDGAQRPPSARRHQQAQQRDKKPAVQTGYGEQMGQPRLLHGHGVALRQLRLVAGQLRQQKAPHRWVVPHGGDLLPQHLDGPQRQPLDAAPAAVGNGHVLPLVQQGVHAPRRELGQLRAADAGGVLPPRRAGQALSRLQRQHLAVAVVHSLGAEKAVQPHGDLAAVSCLLRPRADGGGELPHPAAARQHRLLYRRLIDDKIRQCRHQRPQEELAAPEPAASPRPQAQRQRQQADACRRPQIPAAPRQHQHQK